MKARCWLVVALAVFGLASNLLAQFPSFPGAEGFGAVATGGRGGRVVYVTSLNASGPGSLQDALDQTGPRYILFKVSGVINAPVQLTTDDVTIAGQTSIGGIIVRGFHTTEEPFCDQDPACIATARTAENWILRYIRSRPGDDGGGLDDGLRLLHTQRAIVDHVSVANATDEAIQISFSHDITVQNTILAETLGDHAPLGGMLLNYSDPGSGYELTRISLHHNLWDRIVGRLPEVSRESPGAGYTTMDLELSNNLLWDPGYFVEFKNETFPGDPDHSLPIYYRLNWVGNRSVVRPDFPYGMISFPDPLPNPLACPACAMTRTFWQDNTLNLYPGRSSYQLNYCCNDYPAFTPPAGTPSYALAGRHNFFPVTYLPSGTLLTYARDHAGAFPRDPMDRRLLAPLQTGIFDPAPRDQNPYHDAFSRDPVLLAQPPVDSDGDGMPDDWEIAHGLDPQVQDHNGSQLSFPVLGIFGYTNLEVYLDELADRMEGKTPSPCAEPGRLCLHGQRFAVSAAWRTPPGAFGGGQALRLTDDTGYFWFFGSSNVEVVVKALDGCGVNQHFWVFAAGLTNVEVDLTVTDTLTGRLRQYHSPLGLAFQPLQDTQAFACP